MNRNANTVYEFSAPLLDGQVLPLSYFKSKVLLIANVATHCVYTPQYAALEELYRRYQKRGFEVLGFPCNQFGNQEPGKASEIATFCELNYKVSFPMFAKLDVNGPHAHPLFRYLQTARPGLLWTPRIKWNFTKFLVDRQGRAVKRYAPAADPHKLAGAIEGLLGSKEQVGASPPILNYLFNGEDRVNRRFFTNGLRPDF